MAALNKTKFMRIKEVVVVVTKKKVETEFQNA